MKTNKEIYEELDKTVKELSDLPTCEEEYVEIYDKALCYMEGITWATGLSPEDKERKV